jgi:hypothetical protein
MSRIAAVIVSVAILCYPITTSAGQNPDVKLAMHLVASSASLACADLTPATVADINPSVTQGELGAAGYVCYVVFVAYDFEELWGAEFCATGLPPEVVVMETVWCPPGAPSIGDPWSGGVVVAFQECLEPYDEGEVAVIGYVKTFWFAALGSLPAEIAYCPSSLSYPGDPHNYAVDCFLAMEDTFALEYPCVVGGEVMPTVRVSSPDGGEVLVGGEAGSIA